MGKATSQAQLFSTDFPPKTTAYFPHEREYCPVSKLRFRYQIASFRKIKTCGLDPFFLYKRSYHYVDVKTGEVRTISQDNVHLGFDTELEVGKFYFNPNLEFSYYCVGITDGNVKLALIESYQHGQLVQAEFIQAVQYSHYYMEITDPQEIRRLRKVGSEYLKRYDSVSGS